MVKILTKKEILKTAIKTIILEIYECGKDTIRIESSDEFWNRKAEEILKEVSIRFPMGE